MFVKICGITTAAALDAAVEAGADAIGFVFAESPRRIEPKAARALSAGLPPEVVRVAVFRRPSAEAVREVLDVLAPDWLQADAADLAALTLPGGCRALPVHRAALAGPPPARLLFEGTVSGAGQRADWSAARALAPHTELILAGGLTEDNVGEAIEAVGPWGVDVSSGVERRRGEKDPALIQRFIARVRALEKEAALAAKEEQ